MTKKELTRAVAEYKEYKALLEEAQDQVERLEKELKRELERKGVSELEVGDSVVRNTEFVQKRFDSKEFKAAEPVLYATYVKEVKGHRFSVA